MRLGLTWMSLLHGHLGHTSLAATSGVWSGDDVVKYLLTGADVVMSTSALLRHGPQHIGTLVHGLRDWMDRHGIATLDGLRGRLSASRQGGDAGAFLRAQYRNIVASNSAQAWRR